MIPPKTSCSVPESIRPASFILKAQKTSQHNLKSIVRLWLFISLTLLFSIYGANKAHSQDKPEFYKGFTWGFPGIRGDYLGRRAAESMQKLAETNSNTVCIAFAASMDTPGSTEILWGKKNPDMVTDSEIRHAVQLARENHLKVILKPMVNIKDGTWRARIKFNTKSGEKDLKAWGKWWKEYNAYIIHYAKLAQETQADMFALGCEMNSTEGFKEQWLNLIRSVRKVYSGRLTYNVNHDRLNQVNWWSAVDVISISAYFPVGAVDSAASGKTVKKEDTSVTGMAARWKIIRKTLEQLSRKWNRPIFFIETGMANGKHFAMTPWISPNDSTVDDEGEQARFYEALLKSFWYEPWFIGVTWWDWPARLYSAEQAHKNIGFCVYGKEAEKVVRKWYSKKR
ncbi:hypothetical protein BMS3Abin05_01481 [bacterium BMS3Abin05]|nr:hypothetical protein BMS3Abin05_01481 [bacterium BMS3Abin05]